MRLLPVSVCTSGMKLAKRIYDESGVVLLGEGVELTHNMLQRLESHGIHFLYIQDRMTDDIVVTDLLSDETRIKASRTIRAHFRKMMEQSNRTRMAGSGNIGQAFSPVMLDIIGDLSQNENAMIMLADMQITDHYLYQHSLNVCIYTTLLGMKFGYKRDQLEILGLGALLHDIGKTQVPLTTLMKPDQLTSEEFEQVKRHAELGFQILKEEPNISLVAAHCAYQHHERLNGSGYPRGLHGHQIHEYARWIGMVDAYDAMTTHRVYRKPMLPHQALEILYTESGILFDQRKIELFRDQIAIYPLGLTVRLSTGEWGVVVGLNHAAPHRPIIRVLKNEAGEDLSSPYEVDLSRQLSVMVASTQASKEMIS